MKKAQFYIVAAVILLTIAFVVFAVSNSTNMFKKKTDEFKQLHENYQREVSEVINNMIMQKNQNNLEELSTAKLEDYTASFLKYARSKEPGFGLVYIFRYYNGASLANNLDVNVTVEADSGTNYTVEPSDVININASESYNIYFNDNKYEITQDKDIDFSAIYLSTNNQEVRIFVQQ